MRRIVARVPANRAVNNQADGKLFDRSAFTYQPDTDNYRCPAGRSPVRKQLHRRERCPTCRPIGPVALSSRQCTTARRFIKRHRDEAALTRMNARATPELMAKRRCAAEHPFGTIKRMMAGGRFLTRNFKGTKAEMTLSVLAYNILRAINIKAAIA